MTNFQTTVARLNLWVNTHCIALMSLTKSGRNMVKAFFAAMTCLTCFHVNTDASEREPNELVVLASNASRPAISELVPLFERSSKSKVRVHYANNPVLKQQVEAGANFDVVIIEPMMLQELNKTGFVSNDSIVAIATIGMALVSREGAPPVDIHNVASFKKVLLEADSIAYTADGHSGEVFLRVLNQLGLFEKLKPKLIPVVGRLSTLAVADGSAQYTAFPLAGTVPGVQLAGAFPDEIQTYIGVSAGKNAHSAVPVLADDFIKYLQSESAKILFKSKGYRIPLTRQE